MAWQEQIEQFIPRCAQEECDKRVMLDYIRLFPHNILLRENEFAHITSSGFILNGARDRVLMVHHNIYRTWAWSGGHADGDGDLLGVALREAREETGVRALRPLSESIITLDILPVGPHWKRGKFVCAHQHLSVCYVLLAGEGQALAVKPDENSGVGWFEVSRLAEICNEPYMVGVYQKIVERARALPGL